MPARTLYALAFVLALLALNLCAYLVLRLSFELPAPESYLFALRDGTYASAAVALAALAGWVRETLRR